MIIDTAEAVLLFVLCVITVILVIVGWQVFLVLREFRKTVTKANKVLDDTGVITQSVSGPISSLSSLTAGVKVGALIARILRGKKSSKKNSSQEEYE